MLDKLLALDNLSRMIYLDLVYDVPALKDLFHRLVKTEEPAALERFLSAQGENYRRKLQKWMDEAAPLPEGERPQAAAALEQLFDGVAVRRREEEEETARARERALANRELLRAGIDAVDRCITDQARGLAYPPLFKAHDGADAGVTRLPAPRREVLTNGSLFDCISARRSRRKYAPEGLSVDELSYLLWATQGVRQLPEHRRWVFTSSPSGGARHPFVTYLALNSVDAMKPGLYRYLPPEHALLFLSADDRQRERVAGICRGQVFTGECAVCFIWTAVPYRTEYRYLSAAAKIILQDSGHLCQNLYLACESIGCGACAIGAYHQEEADAFVGVDGRDEMVVYLASVGRQVEGAEP
jgi:SagB-type dehydrogenase family enzyme